MIELKAHWNRWKDRLFNQDSVDHRCDRGAIINAIMSVCVREESS